MMKLHLCHLLPGDEMYTGQELKFYNKHLILDGIGEEGQLALKAAKVLVIGAGGLGCPVLMHLAGAGVGTIGIVDDDKVNISNLHRQNLFGHSQIGFFKTTAAIEKLKDINPYIEYIPFQKLLTTCNALKIIEDFDIVVDATDNFSTRYLINDACVTLDKPFVFASIDRFQGQISVFNYKEKDGTKGPTYRCLFPVPPSPETAPNCSEIGVVGVLPGIIGGLQANEVIKIILRLGKVLSGELLLIDLLQNRFMNIHVQRDNEAVNKIFDLKKEVSESIYQDFCYGTSSGNAKQISWGEIKKNLSNNFQMVDVRENKSNKTIEGSIRIPASQIKDHVAILDRKKNIVLFCDYGITSQKVVSDLTKFGFSNVYNLKGGLQQMNVIE